MKIAVCTIVVNGEDYINEWITHYKNSPVINYICIAEGATKNWMKAHNWTTPESKDRTREIIISHPNIFYSFAKTPYTEKCEQMNAFMALVPPDTDYILYADSDEFYIYSDLEKLKIILETFSPVMMRVYMYHFWKGLDYIGVGGYSWAYDTQIPRIFKYIPGTTFINHRPPTTSLMTDPNYAIIDANSHNIICRHYSYVTKKQVHEKMPYYVEMFKRPYMDWVKNVWDAWTPENREEIEAKYSIHPTGANAKTKKINVEHPEVIQKKFNIKCTMSKNPIKIGTDYGGNVIPEGVLNRDSIVYSFGLGEDASFDIGLIEKYGCKVRIFDPTPRSVEYFATELENNEQILFYPFGIWHNDCITRFYKPKDETHVSCSITNIQETEDYFNVPVHRLKTIMEMLKHSHIDLLKLDIEGAEYEVFADMIASGIKPKVICVEFHKMKDNKTLDDLKNYGYFCFYNINNQYTFTC